MPVMIMSGNANAVHALPRNCCLYPTVDNTRNPHGRWRDTVKLEAESDMQVIHIKCNQIQKINKRSWGESLFEHNFKEVGRRLSTYVVGIKEASRSAILDWLIIHNSIINSLCGPVMMLVHKKSHRPRIISRGQSKSILFSSFSQTSHNDSAHSILITTWSLNENCEWPALFVLS